MKTPFNKEPCIEFVEFPVSGVLAIQTNRCSVSHEKPLFFKGNATCFGGFNVAHHVGDSRECVEYNRNIILDHLPSNKKIQWLNQIHGDNIAIIDDVIFPPPSADAAITSNPNIALAVMTADCLPILLADIDHNEIAVIHAGWRPLSKNIIEKTLKKMTANPSEIIAWLGPCIGVKAFEVGEEVKKCFAELNILFEKCFYLKELQHKQEKKYCADLKKIATVQLNMLGVKQIMQTNDCTFEDQDKYYSYRRDGKTGRMVSMITHQ